MIEVERFQSKPVSVVEKVWAFFNSHSTTRADSTEVAEFVADNLVGASFGEGCPALCESREVWTVTDCDRASGYGHAVNSKGIKIEMTAAEVMTEIKQCRWFFKGFHDNN